ncbi:NAC domain-containing protein 83-like [Oryza brachyantha]|uniref:NAC domain-containing protein n=1 Tax=Oryza brachyantha TaxID=4533 RepID=J3N211_ORYBR|nr:NAC domain-containing protein 83-like [Oryza brachyantha]XP_040384259.1 NAC domain-containing protein 83-like [Oryza brachyantha]
MSPSVPGLPLLNISISSSWSDEERVRFLAERKAEHSLPENVMVGVSFHLFDPWDSENLWYMNFSDDQQSPKNGENAIIKSKTGYWKIVDTVRIPTSTAIVGMKVRLDHYEGEAPSGKRTGWVMNEYLVEENDEANLPQDYKNLCTIYFQEDKKLDAGNKQICLSANARNDRNESYLQYLAELEEQNAASNPQAVSVNEENVSSSKGLDRQKTNASDDQSVNYAPSSEGYIELNDLLSTDASASSSEYSSRRTMISEEDEYFDSDAFLREIRNDHNTDNEEHADSKFSVTVPSKSDHVVISPPEQGFVDNLDNHAIRAGDSPQKSMQSGKADQHSIEEHPQNIPTPSCFPIGHVKRSRSSSSSSSQGTSRSPQRERSTKKFGKLGKKYCCFGSF